MPYRVLSGFLLVTLIASTAFYTTFAQTAQELSSKINQKNDEIAELEKEIKSYQAQLGILAKEKDSLNNQIKQLDLTRKKLNADISITQKEIERTNLKISGLTSDIGDKESSIDNSRLVIAQSVRDMNELEESTTAEILLTEKNITEIWNNIDNMITVREKLKERIAELQVVKSDLEDTRADTVDARDELVTLKTKLSDQKKGIEQNTKEKNKLLSDTKNSEANYQKILAAQIAKKAAFEKELRDYESQLKFILDPSELPGAGVLSWPLDEVFVTQEFGAKTGPHRTYASGHSGTDFRARTPLPAYAMADGVVKGVGNTDTACPGASFGQWVFVEFNNGLSATYAHLSFSKVTEGQKVKRGQVVAYTGGTGRVTGPHLHVSLYVSSGVQVATVPSKSCPGNILKQPIAATSAYQDPMFYLPRI